MKELMPLVILVGVTFLGGYVFKNEFGVAISFIVGFILAKKYWDEVKDD